MRIDPSGVPFIAGALLVAFVVVALAGRPYWAMPAVALALFFAFFFRDPDRRAPVDRLAVIAPADGRVLVAGAPQEGAAPPGEWRQVSIFLSPIDVHVNRVPISGRVTRVDYRRGRFLPAYRSDAAATNERSEVWVQQDGRTVVFRQVVGILARRVVCRLAVGDDVKAGERFGIMKFGSRMDVFIQASAILRVRVGDSVRGGETILAILT